MSDRMEKRLAESYGDLAPDGRIREEVIGGLSAERDMFRPRSARILCIAAGVCAALLLLGVFLPPLGDPPVPAGDGAVRRIAARFVTDGDPDAVMEVMRQRLDALGVDGEVWSEEESGGIELYLPPDADADGVSSTLLRPGTLEFRIVIEDPREPGWRVVECWDDEEPMRVRIDGGFTGADLDPDEIGAFLLQQVDSAVWSVRFAVRKERKKAFETFSKENLKQRLAIIVDGRVLAAPVIQSEMPGSGAIMGGGPRGFTKLQAESLAAALISGAYPAEVRPR